MGTDPFKLVGKSEEVDHEKERRRKTERDQWLLSRRCSVFFFYFCMANHF